MIEILGVIGTEVAEVCRTMLTRCPPYAAEAVPPDSDEVPVIGVNASAEVELACKESLPLLMVSSDN